tara:strand:+ start:219 stop:413 length:195 start_codon:yes stop_codon:yes gene_type:complete
MVKAGDDRTLQDLRNEYIDGYAADIMTFPEFLIKQGHGDKVKKGKSGGKVMKFRKGGLARRKRK